MRRWAPAEAIASASTGNALAVEELIVAIWPACFRLATMVTGDRGVAEDAAQETCVIVHRKVHGLRRIEAFDAWLYRIVMHESAKVRRRSGHVAEQIDRSAMTDGTISVDVWRALGELPAELRAVTVLFYFHDLTGDEIAAALRISHGANLSGRVPGRHPEGNARGDALHLAGGSPKFHFRSISAWQDFVLDLFLFDSSSVNTGEVPPMPNGEKPLFGPVVHWSVGRETVIVSDRAFVSHLAEIKDAMLRLTPMQSLAQTLPLLYRVTHLGGLDRIADAAGAIAPAEGRSVLVDRGNLGQVATLARQHKALLSIRTTTVDNLPIVDGKPDFAHQSSHFDREVALSADGVRALAAVLATGACGSGGRMGSGFTCEMLINERSGRAYWIWILPLSPSTPPTKYIVDSATFRIEQSR